MLGTAMLAGWLLWGTSLLGVRSVEVAGADLVAAEEVVAVAGVDHRTPLLRVRESDVAERVGQLPAVASVQVHRQFPDTVVIEVVEREPVAAVSTGGEFALVDAEGLLFHELPRPPAGLPEVVVSDAGDAGEQIRAALTVLAALAPPLREQLLTVMVTGPVSIELELSSGWTVIWGDEHDSELKARVVAALLDQEGEIIDVSAPQVVSVR